jgi:DNA-binding Lrp family transcriptional regulator
VVPVPAGEGDFMSAPVVVDYRDRELLQWLQDEFAVTARPWLAGGMRLGMSEEEVLSRVRRLSAGGVIRSVHTILDKQKTGNGSSTLIAMRVPSEAIPDTVSIINEYPQVTHNYLREYPFNLWFTVNAADESGLATTIDQIKRRTGVQDTGILDLRTRRIFKTDVRFRFFKGAHITRTPRDFQRTSAAMDETDRALLRITQRAIPLAEEPFREIAAQLHIGQEEVQERLKRRIRDGTIKRIGGSVSQRKLGITANAVVAWNVHDDLVEGAGKRLSLLDEVTHCYERTTVPGVWEYNLFTVLHGNSREWVETFAKTLSSMTCIDDYRVIFSSQQFKRTSMIHELYEYPGTDKEQQDEKNGSWSGAEP